MKYRPVDGNGDVLPVLCSADLLSGAPAVAMLVQDRLDLLAGDWWENPEKGNSILEMLKESRLTEADQQALGTYLTSYIRETPGVQDVRDAAFFAAGRQFSYSCTVVTDYGPRDFHYTV